MSEQKGTFKIGAIIWALCIGGGLIFLAGSVILPSTKRSHINFDQLRHHEETQAEAQSATPVEPQVGVQATQP